MITTIPRVEFLRVQIADAKHRGFDRQREAGRQFIERFKEHLDKLIADPHQFTSHTLYSEELKGDMYDKNVSETFFIEYVKTQLSDLGYRVEKGHDGGGMYGTIVVRWDIEKSKRKFGDVGPPYERSNVDMPPCTGTTSMYAPGTR